jgi:hypothetical protein
MNFPIFNHLKNDNLFQDKTKMQHKPDSRTKMTKKYFYFACNYKIKTTFADN